MKITVKKDDDGVCLYNTVGLFHLASICFSKVRMAG